jgi:hypothetical protein
MFDIWQKEGIRYWDLVPKLFKSDGEQEMIPFFGAGVSVSDRQDKEPAFQPEYPDKRTLDEVADLLKIKGRRPPLSGVCHPNSDMDTGMGEC